MPPCYSGCGFARSGHCTRPKAEFVCVVARSAVLEAFPDWPTLAFGELESLARALLAVLLSFMLPGVACQQPKLFQFWTQLGIEFDECARDTQPRRAGLSGGATAVGQNDDVELVGHLGRKQRLPDHGPSRLIHEIMFESPAVDGDGALARAQEDARDRGLSPACS